MPIRPLPPTTTSHLTSTQLLPSSLSLTKELLDNALDARATSVTIELSSNSLDVIQVRDNGHGIAPEDRALLALKNCTSKIGKFEELRSLGGRSLGFRGVALSCVADVAGSLSITTRVEGEAAAVRLEIGRDGQVIRFVSFISRWGLGRLINFRGEMASHPVGTTVRATNIFRNFPVREQMCLKAGGKNLAGVQRMLQGYALARPGVRIAMRVLKARSEKVDFTYAPKAGATAPVEDAVVKILGRNVVSQCEWVILEEDGFEIQAFLPRADAELGKIKDVGQFVSVDSRPVSAGTGTLKQIVSMFKEALRKSCESMEGVKDPFLFLNVVCPAGAYDPNVEPAKDDVLFDDGEKVVTPFEKLLDSFYSKPKEQDLDEMVGTVRSDNAVHKVPAQEDTEEEELPQVERPPFTDDALMIEDDELAFLEQRQTLPIFRSNMYGCDDEDLDLAVEEDFGPEDQQELRETAKDVNLSNPWTIARMAGNRRATNLTMRMHESPQLLSIPGDEPAPRLAAGHILIDIPDGAIVPRSQISEEHARSQLPAPPVSSSPVYGTPLDAIPQVSAPKMPRRERRPGNVNRPFVSPVQPQARRDPNWFDFGQLESSQRPQKTHAIAPQRRHSKRLNRTEPAHCHLESISDASTTHNLQLVLRLTTADISSTMEMLEDSSNQLKWAMLPDPPGSTLPHPPDSEEVEAWCKRLTRYLRAEFRADDGFEDLQRQMERAFAKMV